MPVRLSPLARKLLSWAAEDQGFARMGLGVESARVARWLVEKGLCEQRRPKGSVVFVATDAGRSALGGE